jgi:type IV pilus assembly protein PilW
MRAHSIRGFTLIEIMIAMLIGMIGIVVMMQTFSVSEGFKRTATSGTEAQTNGAVALYMLEREIRLAGYGMNALVPAGCQSVRVWNSAAGTSTTMRLVPFEINPAGIPAGDPNTDVLMIAYGNADSFVVGVQADNATASPTSPFVIYSNLQGFRNGDLIVSVMPGVGPGGAASCIMHEVTMAPGAANNCSQAPLPPPNQLAHDTGNYKKVGAGCALTAPTHNNATGIVDSDGKVMPAVVRSKGGLIYSLGTGPSIKVYAIRGGNLTYCDMVAIDCTVAANYSIAVNDVVSLRAVYGKDFTPAPSALPGDGVVDLWDRRPFANAFEATRVLAAMVEVTARSSIKEKADSNGKCDYINSDPSKPDKLTDWIGNAYVGIDISQNLTGAPEPAPEQWKCYRYKLFQTTVPLRNMIWRP